jgi:hypothetical protein
MVSAYFFATLGAQAIVQPLSQTVEDSQVALGLDLSRGERER